MLFHLFVGLTNYSKTLLNHVHVVVWSEETQELEDQWAQSIDSN